MQSYYLYLTRTQMGVSLSHSQWDSENLHVLYHTPSHDQTVGKQCVVNTTEIRAHIFYNTANSEM